MIAFSLNWVFFSFLISFFLCHRKYRLLDSSANYITRVKKLENYSIIEVLFDVGTVYPFVFLMSEVWKIPLSSLNISENVTIAIAMTGLVFTIYGTMEWKILRKSIPKGNKDWEFTAADEAQDSWINEMLGVFKMINVAFPFAYIEYWLQQHYL